MAMPRARAAAGALLLLLALAGCEAGTRLRLLHDGIGRSAVLDLPPPAAGPRPLLIVLHGALLDGGEARAELRLGRRAAQAGMGLAFPDAAAPLWNDLSLARAVPAMGGAADDIGFLDALVARLVAEGRADPRAIHLAGISNGGMMALRYACTRADRLASLMLVMATMAREDAAACRPARPLPVLMLAGTADPVTRWDGQVAMAGLVPLQQRMSVPESFDFWRAANGCAGPVASRPLPRRGGAYAPGVVLHEAGGCVPTLLYEVRGGGHRLPGDDWPLLAWLGPATFDLDPAALLLGFARSATPP
jgi:polyhydroxybutyrate depolymerase